jgi:hypothetical protein
MGMVMEMIEENRQGLGYVSRAVDQCEAIFCSDFEKMRGEVRKEMAKERSNMLVLMSSLTKLWKLFAANGACVDAATGVVFGDCGDEVDAIGECWSANELQEHDDTGDREVSLRYTRYRMWQPGASVVRLPSGRLCHVGLGLMWAGRLWMGRVTMRRMSRMSRLLRHSECSMVWYRSLLMKEKISGGPMVVAGMWRCRTGFG